MTHWVKYGKHLLAFPQADATSKDVSFPARLPSGSPEPWPGGFDPVQLRGAYEPCSEGLLSANGQGSGAAPRRFGPRWVRARPATLGIGSLKRNAWAWNFAGVGRGSHPLKRALVVRGIGNPPWYHKDRFAHPCRADLLLQGIGGHLFLLSTPNM